MGFFYSPTTQDEISPLMDLPASSPRPTPTLLQYSSTQLIMNGGAPCFSASGRPGVHSVHSTVHAHITLKHRVKWNGVRYQIRSMVIKFGKETHFQGDCSQKSQIIWNKMRLCHSAAKDTSFHSAVSGCEYSFVFELHYTPASRMEVNRI